MIVSPKHCQFKFRSILPKKNFVSPGTMWTKIFRRVDISIGLWPREEKCAATKLVLTMMAVMGPRSVFFLSWKPLWIWPPVSSLFYVCLFCLINSTVLVNTKFVRRIVCCSTRFPFPATVSEEISFGGEQKIVWISALQFSRRCFKLEIPHEIFCIIIGGRRVVKVVE